MAQGIAHLSAAMAGGDAEAVEAFYRQYFDSLYSHARRCTRRDESFCLDVVQDAVLRVIRTVKQVDSEPRFRGWLKLVVQTTAFDLLRNERRRKNREAMSAVTPFSTDADADSLQLDWLAEQISRLDPELVRIIEMRFERSWTLRRIGQTLGISGGAVDGRLRRALRKVELSPDEDPERDGASRRGPDSPAIAETPMVLSPTAQLSQPQERPVEHLKPAVHSASTAAEPPSTEAAGMQDSATAESTMGVPPMAVVSPPLLQSEEQAQPIGETPMVLSPTTELSQPQESAAEHLKPAVHSASTAAEPPSTKATGMQDSATAERTMGVPPMAPESQPQLQSEEQAQPTGETPMVLSPTTELSQPQESAAEHLKPAVHSASTAAEPPSTKATGMQYSATAEPTMGVPPMAPELTILPSEEQAQPIGETPMILSPASVTVEDTIEDLTLAGLEDEAGAHDDRL
jgi:RNA polymerase sigma factor (sigma-70 family)